MLDYLLGLLQPRDDAANGNHAMFRIWPGIRTDDTATWSPQLHRQSFNGSRYQLLPYLASHHWQLAMYDMEDHIILRYDSFWLDRVDLFTFLVCASTFMFRAFYLSLRQVLEQCLDKNGGNPRSLGYRHEVVKVETFPPAADETNHRDQEIPYPVDVHDTGLITWWISRQLISGQQLDATAVNWTVERRSAAQLLRHAE